MSSSSSSSSSPFIRSSPYSVRSNYPTDSFTHSKESGIRTTSLTVHNINIDKNDNNNPNPNGENKQSSSSLSSSLTPSLLSPFAFTQKSSDLGLNNVLERQLRDESLLPDITLNKDSEGNITFPKHEAVKQSLQYKTSSNAYGEKKEKVGTETTKEFRYFPRNHGFTKNWTGNYRASGMDV